MGGKYEMSVLYIAENGAMLGVEGNRLTVKYKDGLLRSIPIETIEGITLLGKNQLTTQCMETCMEMGIPVSFFSRGRYFGRLMSTGYVKAHLQRKQTSLYESEFAVGLSKRLISAKITNQIVVLRRYAKSKNNNVDDEIFNMQNSNRIVYALVIYDIVDNKTRVKFAKFLQGYGNRIQKSGFEVVVSEKKFDKLLSEISKYCSSKDSIRVYRITGQNLVYKWGTDNSMEQDDLIII